MEFSDSVLRETLRTYRSAFPSDLERRDHRRPYNCAVLAAGDVSAATAALVGANLLVSGSALGPVFPWGMLAAAFLWVLGAFSTGLYPGWGRDRAAEIRSIALVWSSTVALSALLLLFVGQSMADVRSAMPLAWILGLVLIPAAHHGAKSLLLRSGQYGRAVVIYGANETGRRMAHALSRRPFCGLRPIAFLDDHPGTWGASVQGIPVLGDTNIVLPEARVAILALGEIDPGYRRHLLDGPLSYYDDVIVTPDDAGIPDAWDDAFSQGGTVGLVLSRRPVGLRRRATSRLMDLGIVLAAAPIWLPVLAGMTLAGRIRLGRNPLSRCPAVGRSGRTFDLYYLSHRQTQHAGDTGRSVPAGPAALINVVRGEMSLVGPQPLCEEEHAELPDDVRRTRDRVKPGLTGPWRITDHPDGFDQAAETAWIRHRTFWNDLEVGIRWIKWNFTIPGLKRNE